MSYVDRAKRIREILERPDLPAYLRSDDITLKSCRQEAIESFLARTALGYSVYYEGLDTPEEYKYDQESGVNLALNVYRHCLTHSTGFSLYRVISALLTEESFRSAEPLIDRFEAAAYVIAYAGTEAALRATSSNHSDVDLNDMTLTLPDGRCATVQAEDDLVTLHFKVAATGAQTTDATSQKEAAE